MAPRTPSDEGPSRRSRRRHEASSSSRRSSGISKPISRRTSVWSQISASIGLGRPGGSKEEAQDISVAFDDAIETPSAIETLSLTADPHTQKDLAMAFESRTLDSLNASVHSELQRRRQIENWAASSTSGPANTTIAAHLDTTPPVSPSKYIPSSMQRDLTNDDWDTLIANDRKLHKLKNDLDGLREWWESNRKAWILNRIELRKIQEGLNNLREDMYERPLDERAFWQQQVDRQIWWESEWLRWFEENREQRDTVYHQFEKITREADNVAQATSAVSSPESRLLYDSLSAKARLVRDGIAGRAEILNWLHEPKDDLHRRISILQNLFNEYDNVIIAYNKEYNKLEEEVSHGQNLAQVEDQQFQDIINDLEAAEDQGSDGRGKTRLAGSPLKTLRTSYNAEIDLQRDKWMQVKDAREKNLQDLQNKCNVLILNIAAYTEARFITEQRLALTDQLYGRVDDCIANIYSYSDQEASVRVIDLLNILGILTSRDETAGQLASLLVAITRLGIVDAEDVEDIEIHFVGYGDRLWLEIDAATSDSNSPEEVLGTWKGEQTQLRMLYERLYSKVTKGGLDLRRLGLEEAMLVEANSTIARKPLFRDHSVREDLVARYGSVKFPGVPESVRTASTAPSIVSTAPAASVTSKWGTIESDHQAIKILEQDFHYLNTQGLHATTSVYWVLKLFILQPDISPYFRDLQKISQEDFLILVHKHCTATFSVQQVDAFLYFCHEYKEFFTRFSGQVLRISEGWETVDEAIFSPDTIQRTRTLSTPSGAEEFEHQLHRYQDELCEGPLRDITEAKLFYFVNQRMQIGRQKVEML